MRFLVPALMLSLTLAGAAAHADPVAPGAPRTFTADDFSQVRFGAVLHWAPERLGRRVGLGLGWTLPQRWYDVAVSC
jgi:hypothetical protein